MHLNLECRLFCCKNHALLSWFILFIPCSIFSHSMMHFELKCCLFCCKPSCIWQAAQAWICALQLEGMKYVLPICYYSPICHDSPAYCCLVSIVWNKGCCLLSKCYYLLKTVIRLLFKLNVDVYLAMFRVKAAV